MYPKFDSISTLVKLLDSKAIAIYLPKWSDAPRIVKLLRLTSDDKTPSRIRLNANLNHQDAKKSYKTLIKVM